MAEKESAGRDDWVQPESPIVENGCENNEIQQNLVQAQNDEDDYGRENIPEEKKVVNKLEAPVVEEQK